MASVATFIARMKQNSLYDIDMVEHSHPLNSSSLR